MLIDYAYSHNITTLKADVSITGVPLFNRNGFEIVQKQKKILNGIEIVNYSMIKAK